MFLLRWNGANRVDVLLDISGNELAVATHAAIEVDKVVGMADGTDALCDLFALPGEALVLVLLTRGFHLGRSLLQTHGRLGGGTGTALARFAIDVGQERFAHGLSVSSAWGQRPCKTPAVWQPWGPRRPCSVHVVHGRGLASDVPRGGVRHLVRRLVGCAARWPDMPLWHSRPLIPWQAPQGFQGSRTRDACHRAASGVRARLRSDATAIPGVDLTQLQPARRGWVHALLQGFPRRKGGDGFRRNRDRPPVGGFRPARGGGDGGWKRPKPRNSTDSPACRASIIACKHCVSTASVCDFERSTVAAT